MLKFLIALCLCSSVFIAVNGWEIDDENTDLLSLEEGEQCKLKTGEVGVCRLLQSCRVYYEGLQNKTIPYSFLNRCSFIHLDEVICCPLDDNTNSPVNIELLTGEIGTPRATRSPATESAPTRRNGGERPSVAACREYSGALLGFHILNGLPVSPGEYPHMGGLVYEVGGGQAVDYRCGGSLISERYVLTAAHCVDDPLSLPIYVRMGVVEWNATQDDENSDGILPVDVAIENITLHSDYRPNRRYHDIALIKLREAVEFSAFVRPACLETDINDIDSSIPLVVIGWGVTNIQTRVRSGILLQTNVTTVPLRDCNTTHIKQGTHRSYKSGLDAGQYCAYDPDYKNDACESDSGGPLQLVQNGESTIVGVISFGVLCATAVPAVYARVAFYLDWIESIVWPS